MQRIVKGAQVLKSTLTLLFEGSGFIIGKGSCFLVDPVELL